MEVNPYAPPKAEIQEDKKLDLTIDLKKVEYQKYRDEIISFVILLLCCAILLIFPIGVFIVGVCFCLSGLVISLIKFKKAKKEYFESIGRK